MKIINYGHNYEVYSDELQTFNTLPPGTYKIAFNPMSGFSLVKIDDFKTTEEKIYGNHKEKIKKVLKSYDHFNRSLGIILSGEKGIGKSLFVQLLSTEVIEKRMPVILVTKAFPGVADFIDKINQEALFIFDEFEKVFSISGENGETQNDLLGLFDGTSQKKHIYALTVNKLHQVSEFILSRTGRFHYHIRFDYPTASEIEKYLQDKLDEEYYGEIKNVIAFASRVKLNYDRLRAIAFELNQGYSFSSAIEDLNILTTDNQHYDVKVQFSNGKTEEIKNQYLNLFDDSIELNFYATNDDWFSINFPTRSMYSETLKMVVDGEDVKLETRDDNTVYTEDVHVSSVIITHFKDTSVNYRLAY